MVDENADASISQSFFVSIYYKQRKPRSVHKANGYRLTFAVSETRLYVNLRRRKKPLKSLRVISSSDDNASRCRIVLHSTVASRSYTRYVISKKIKKKIFLRLVPNVNPICYTQEVCSLEDEKN